MRPEGSERAALNAISHILNEAFLSLRTDFLKKKEALLTYGLERLTLCLLTHTTGFISFTIARFRANYRI